MMMSNRFYHFVFVAIFMVKFVQYTKCGVCFGNETLICSGHGECVSEVCECEVNYFGELCEFVTNCAGLTGSDPNVCSGHGECLHGDKQDFCQCEEGYSPNDELSSCKKNSDTVVVTAIISSSSVVAVLMALFLAFSFLFTCQICFLVLFLVFGCSILCYCCKQMRGKSGNGKNSVSRILTNLINEEREIEDDIVVSEKYDEVTELLDVQLGKVTFFSSVENLLRYLSKAFGDFNKKNPDFFLPGIKEEGGGRNKDEEDEDDEVDEAEEDNQAERWYRYFSRRSSMKKSELIRFLKIKFGISKFVLIQQQHKKSKKFAKVNEECPCQIKRLNIFVILGMRDWLDSGGGSGFYIGEIIVERRMPKNYGVELVSYDEGESYSLMYMGTYCRGKREGENGKLFNERSEIIYEGQFEDNLMHGNGVLYEWFEDDLNRRRKMKVFEGKFCDGNCDGEGKRWRRDGKCYKEFWEDGELVTEERLESEDVGEQDSFSESENSSSEDVSDDQSDDEGDTSTSSS